MIKHFKSQNGQSLLEVIIALAIFSLVASSLAVMVLGGFSGLEQGGEHLQAKLLASQQIEDIRLLREIGFNELAFSQDVTTSTIGQYDSTVTYEDVCRDGSNDIIACPGSYTDVYMQKITSQVDWIIRGTITNTVKQITYLTNWDSIDWTQTDWSGGNGQTIWSDETEYDSDDSNIDVSIAGEVSLLYSPAGGCTGTVTACGGTGGGRSGCEVQAGCVWSKGNCTGVATPCIDLSDQISCEDQEVCSWGGVGGDYALSGLLVSSKFNMSDNSPIQVIEWDENIPTCSPVCAIKLQIRSANNQGQLSSAEWSGPEGEDGDETDYFTVSTGELIHTDHNGDQWMQYQVFLSGNGSETPIFEKIKVNYK